MGEFLTSHSYERDRMNLLALQPWADHGEQNELRSGGLSVLITVEEGTLLSAGSDSSCVEFHALMHASMFVDSMHTRLRDCSLCGQSSVLAI